MSDMPEEVKAWRSIPEVDHCGTWSETRYPDEAIVYIRSDLVIRKDDPDLRALVEALRWFEGHRKDAIARAKTISAPEDAAIKALCERFGYGAVMDAAARLWTRKDPNGAFYIGGCVGGTSEPQALTDLRAMMEKLK